MCHVSSESWGGAKVTSKSRRAVSRARPRCPRVCFAASGTSRSRRRSRALPAAVIRLVLRRRSLESVPRTTSPARARPDISRVRSESRVTIRVPISVQDSPSRPAARRIRRTLYWDGESPAAAVTALDRSAASHAARTSAISTSSSSESRIAIAAAGVGTDIGDNYSSRGVLLSARSPTTSGTLHRHYSSKGASQCAPKSSLRTNGRIVRHQQHNRATTELVELSGSPLRYKELMRFWKPDALCDSHSADWRSELDIN